MTIIRLSLFGDSRIFINGKPITSGATHLFALTFLLAHKQERRITRLELQRFLFQSISARQASHNLRQLLYRLRSLGIELDERPTGLRLVDSSICGADEHLRSLSPREVGALRSDAISFLPSYTPNLPTTYLKWVDSVRDAAEHQLRLSLHRQLDTFRDSQAWATAVHLGRLLLEGDPCNEGIVATVAESLAILGRRQESLSLIDRYAREVAGEQRSSRLQSLRLRVNRLPESKREPGIYGRESSLLFLQRHWDEPHSKGARQLAVVGHSGVGKTRLASAFAATLSLSGVNVVRYECDVHSRDQPFSLFAHILPELQSMRGSLGASPDHNSTLGRICHAAAFGEMLPHPEGSLGTFRNKAQAALIDLMEAISSEGRLLLIIDDAHYLDDASRSVICALTGTPNEADVVIVLCLRRSPSGQALLTHKRCVALTIEPLSESASRALLSDILADRSVPASHVAWCLEHAAGNPFYLHVLANHSTQSAAPTPFDICSLAARSYSALSSEARSVLESCLFLGRFATLVRVHAVTHIGDDSMIAALRTLEEQDLIHSVNGVLSGPHALLHDALRDLIPSSIAALLHRRIALALQDECIQEGLAPSFALMAARSWLMAGDPQAATRLLRQCASHASSLGEPGMAVTLLSEALTSTLPSSLRAMVLEDLIAYEQAVGSQAKAAAALRDRYQIARDSGEAPTLLSELELRIVEADLLNGGRLESAIDPLLALLEDSTVHTPVRLRAAVRLMILADQDLDVRLALRVHGSAQSLRASQHDAEFLVTQEELIFNTSFGDVVSALRLAEKLAASFPTPSLDAFATRSRSFAAYAFYRLRCWQKAIALCEDTYDFMSRHRAASHALYSASLLAEMAVTEGRLSDAAVWLGRANAAAGGTAPHKISPSSGLYYASSVLSMMEGRYDDAEHFYLAPESNFPILAAARNKAVSTAIGLRIRQLRGDTESMTGELTSLESLYERGRTLGGQDSIVEALWCARIMSGDVPGASGLLHDYLTLHRREISEPDWSLRFVTGADDAWQRLGRHKGSSGEMLSAAFGSTGAGERTSTTATRWGRH